MSRSDPYQARARELAITAGLNPDDKVERPGLRPMPVWCQFRQAARDEHLAREAAALTVTLQPQKPEYQVLSQFEIIGACRAASRCRPGALAERSYEPQSDQAIPLINVKCRPDYCLLVVSGRPTAEGRQVLVRSGSALQRSEFDHIVRRVLEAPRTAPDQGSLPPSRTGCCSSASPAFSALQLPSIIFTRLKPGRKPFTVGLESAKAVRTSTNGTLWGAIGSEPGTRWLRLRGDHDPKERAWLHHRPTSQS